MYSILVLGSDWFSTSVIRTIRQANYKQHNIRSITAATKGMNFIDAALQRAFQIFRVKNFAPKVFKDSLEWWIRSLKILAYKIRLKESFLKQKVSSVEYERYIYDQKTRPLFPLACDKLNIPIIPYDGSNERYQYVSWN